MSLRLVARSVSGLLLLGLSLFADSPTTQALAPRKDQANAGRERISFNENWRFHRTEFQTDDLAYDYRPDISLSSNATILKPWILASGNEFIKDPANRHVRPDGHPGGDAPIVQLDFNDSDWESVTLPHDWAIQGPFYTEEDPIIGGGMGRLPVHGVGWYRNRVTLAPADKGKKIYLDIDGAMSYAIVWLNGNLVGGWPYGYNSFRLDLTPYLEEGEDNQLAIRLDNPPDSARWYPGGGLYRNVWITKTDPTHVALFGTFVTSKDVSKKSATVDLSVRIDNGPEKRTIRVEADVYEISAKSGKIGKKVAEFPSQKIELSSSDSQSVSLSTQVKNPKLWGPPPTQTPSIHAAVIRLYDGKDLVDTYETRFGIRDINFTGEGLLINGERVQIRGVNQHHDLGALGAAFNIRAAKRQLDILRELGSNAIRMSHNPPATELLEMTDAMGFLVIDEIFDSWQKKKTISDFHLIFDDWYEPDLRAFMRRDRNHPSVIGWSVGNEVGEQHDDEAGAVVARRVVAVAKDEDTTRPITASMNFAKPDMPFPPTMDIVSLNYQGEGIRDSPAYSHLTGITTSPQYPAFHDKFPDKLIFSSESAAALSTRGTYIFPVTDGISAPVNETSGGNKAAEYVSSYELYSADFGSSPDKVFRAQDNNSFVAGEFVWSGFDYIGEPTPYYSGLSRSSYFGIIDLAGFPKDRFYLYQSRWRPDLKMAHILPHWNWPERVGQVTPVHVFTSGDEAELFLNGKSLGRQKKAEFQYRFRWDDVEYQAGELKVVAYKNGERWAEDSVRTTGPASQLRLSSDADNVAADGKDLVFVTLEVVDEKRYVVSDAQNTVTFAVDGPGELVATDNGKPNDVTPFPSKERNAFNGLALAIVRATGKGKITISATGNGLQTGKVVVRGN
ncbi:uncharacterized protein DNG_08999 [Cephalotrichum gorgonifer]|uniref:Beta-galactosidase n=1 Tax=Cephalotrichum gorgonifer TaxID=2041049 RepID=A0AAE8N7P9_9PEZI|nr:uncharacterized protein DNG_08999 [Cephalotrichum gorgonifer]